MAPLGRLASVALGLACCMALTRAQDDAPVFLAGVTAPQEDSPAVLLAPAADVGADASVEVDGPVFLTGVTSPNEDSPPVLLAGNATNGSDAPVFLTGVTAPQEDSPAILLGDSATPPPAPLGAETTNSGKDVVLGAWPSMPIGDKEIDFLVNTISTQANYSPALSFGVCMKDLFSLEYQSVAGTNFRYSGHGCLVQSGSTAMGACSDECAVEQLSVTIFTQEWTNTVQITSIARLQMTE